jgi:DNA-binding PadR family transcriptional regulator
VSVRQSLLAILDQGPCYGYQLRAEFDRRTGSTWPLNVGQIYSTLDRLERDGLVAKGATDEHGHVYYAITDAGSAEVTAWLTSPVDPGDGTRDERAIKLALAVTLPGVDAEAVVQVERSATESRLTRLAAAREATAELEGPEDVARYLIIDSMIFAAEAQVRWLEHTERLLSRRPRQVLALELSTDRPKRGRPAHVDDQSARAV